MPFIPVRDILSAMKRPKQTTRERTIRSWKHARAGFERWRRNLATLQVELKQPRTIDIVPIDFVGGEPTEQAGKPMQKFQGQLIYFTDADVTFRRPSGAILVVDNYEIASLSDGKTRFEPE